ncbi:MAG: type I glyceraldehyde-3-phosphate dehydrogenase [Gammaproteobacteria bacterium]
MTKTVNIAINGFGRIGRNILRALFEAHRSHELNVVAINDLGDAKTNAHLLQYDTTHGRFQGQVRVEDDRLFIDNHGIQVFAERNPENLPWEKLGVHLVLECTGLFTTKEKASMHLKAGAKKVLISAPASDKVDGTIVYGVNHDSIRPEHQIISNASCTTNCLAPLAKILNDKFGIESGIMNTVHAYTNDQVLNDVYHSDLRRARSATQSLIPTKTGAAQAVGLVLPELNGKLDGFAIRVPTINVSLVDFSFVAKKPVTVEAVNQAIEDAAHTSLRDILQVNHAPLVSVDFNHTSASAIFDATQTKVLGNLVKVLAWYDNEWGFSNRMLDTAWQIAKVSGWV